MYREVGDGLILIDRFLASLRECSERRNMKHGFITDFDSPQFSQGVRMLIAEIQRCAKTLDGKYDYSATFRLFDKDESGSIMLSEFEATIRELGIGQYLSESVRCTFTYSTFSSSSPSSPSSSASVPMDSPSGIDTDRINDGLFYA
jgi:hypothetical protein